MKIVGLLYGAFAGNLSEFSPYELAKNRQKEDDVPIIKLNYTLFKLVAQL